jgi:hypothetical protein
MDELEDELVVSFPWEELVFLVVVVSAPASEAAVERVVGQDPQEVSKEYA